MAYDFFSLCSQLYVWFLKTCLNCLGRFILGIGMAIAMSFHASHDTDLLYLVYLDFLS